MRTVFEGSIEVASNDHVPTVMKGDDFVEVEIDGLDELFTRWPRLDLALDYPFEAPFEGRVIGDGGSRSGS